MTFGVLALVILGLSVASVVGFVRASHQRNLALDAQVVPEVDVALPPGQCVLAGPVEGQHHLEVVRAVSQGAEDDLAADPVEHEPPHHTDALTGRGVRLEVDETVADGDVGGGPGVAEGVGIVAVGAHPVQLLPTHLHLLREVVAPSQCVARFTHGGQASDQCGTAT